MSPSDNKSKEGSAGKLNTVHLVTGIIVSLIAILGFLGIRQASDLFPATATSPAQKPASAATSAPSLTLSTLTPTLASSRQTPAEAMSPTPTTASISPAFTDTPQPIVAAADSDSVTPDPPPGQILLNQPFETSVPGLLATLKSIEILPTGATRWHFEFWNKSNKTIRIRPTNESYVVDDQGNLYALLSGFEQRIQPGVRAEASADFDTPKPGAQVFTLYLINYYIDANFKQPTLIVSAALSPSATIQPTPVSPGKTNIEVNQLFETSVPGLLATLKSIEILPTGATRWHFEFWNKSNKTIRIRPTNESYVVDDQGKHYALLSGFEQRIQPGVRAEASADFDTPKPGAQVFTLYLINYYIDANFKQPTLSLPIALQ